MSSRTMYLKDDEFEARIHNGTLYIRDPNGGGLFSISIAKMVLGAATGCRTAVRLETGDTGLTTVQWEMHFSDEQARLKATGLLYRLLSGQIEAIPEPLYPANDAPDEVDYLVNEVAYQGVGYGSLRGLYEEYLNITPAWRNMEVIGDNLLATVPRLTAMTDVTATVTIGRVWREDKGLYQVTFILAISPKVDILPHQDERTVSHDHTYSFTFYRGKTDAF